MGLSSLLDFVLEANSLVYFEDLDMNWLKVIVVEDNDWTLHDYMLNGLNSPSACLIL